MNMNIYEYYVSGRHAYVFPQDMLMYEDMLMFGKTYEAYVFSKCCTKTFLTVGQ